MTSDLAIRTADVGDLPKLLGLYQHLSPGDPPCPLVLAENNFTEFLRYKGSAILVGMLTTAMVSSCVLVIVPNLSRGGRPYGLIENVVTHTDYRNRGYGKQTLDAACQHAWHHGCYKVMLMTGSTRASTLRFYQSAGFAQTKTGFQKRAPGF